MGEFVDKGRSVRVFRQPDNSSGREFAERVFQLRTQFHFGWLGTIQFLRSRARAFGVRLVKRRNQLGRNLRFVRWTIGCEKLLANIVFDIAALFLDRTRRDGRRGRGRRWDRDRRRGRGNGFARGGFRRRRDVKILRHIRGRSRFFDGGRDRRGRRSG